LVDYLKRHEEIEKNLEKNGKLVFYTTDDVNKFKELGGKFLGRQISDAKKVTL
jgi:glutamate racemase